MQIIKISEVTPKHTKTELVQRPHGHAANTIDTSNDIVVIEEKCIDLVSVTSDEFHDDDSISFDEGRLQQWNGTEFRMQLAGALSGIILLFGCASISAWAIADFVKDMQENGDEWIDVDYEMSLFGDGDDEFFQSRHVIIAMVVLSWNVGYIIGGVFGAFVVPILPNRTIYVGVPHGKSSFLSFS